MGVDGEQEKWGVVGNKNKEKGHSPLESTVRPLARCMSLSELTARALSHIHFFTTSSSSWFGGFVWTKVIFYSLGFLFK